MDLSMFDAAGQALLTLADPFRLLMLASGVVLGLVLGILPGIGGLAGAAILLPFTFSMDPYAALALLLGLASTTATGDPIPAILMGVPGGAGSAATVLDGVPMAKRGEASRALSAAYMSSLLGGVFGALLIALLLPFLRQAALLVGSPEMLAFAVVGLAMVSALSGNAPLRGLSAAGIGLMIAMVGADPQSGVMRWTFGQLYLFDGWPLVPIVLGLFALPELADMAIARTSIARQKIEKTQWQGMIQGARDTFANWWLVIRCSSLGSVLGAIPGVGGPVIDWLAYAHALKTEKGAPETFGKGDIRGVIASESSNNAKEGGALIPTIAFGVPGSIGMAILLGAFLIHGIVPGPEMLTKHLDVTYAMIWSIALANILGAGLCYLLSPQFARLATLRYTLILPIILSIVFVGAFQGSTDWGDLYSLIGFGILGWIMKQLKWPRAPLILGVVLGSVMEPYLFISIQRYGWEWLTRPGVVVLLSFAAYAVLRPVLTDLRNGAGRTMFARRAPRLSPSLLLPLGFFVVVAAMMAMGARWPVGARTMPMIVGGIVLVCLAATMATTLWGHQLGRRIPEPQPVALGADAAPRNEAVDRLKSGLHMDLESDFGDLSTRAVWLRGGVFLLWMLGFLASMALIGLIPTVPLFVVAYMRIEGRESWRTSILLGLGLAVAITLVFDRLLSLPWPQTVLGGLLPALRDFVPSL